MPMRETSILWPFLAALRISGRVDALPGARKIRVYVHKDVFSHMADVPGLVPVS